MKLVNLIQCIGSFDFFIYQMERMLKFNTLFLMLKVNEKMLDSYANEFSMKLILKLSHIEFEFLLMQ